MEIFVLTAAPRRSKFASNMFVWQWDNPFLSALIAAFNTVNHSSDCYSESKNDDCIVQLYKNTNVLANGEHVEYCIDCNDD